MKPWTSRWILPVAGVLLAASQAGAQRRTEAAPEVEESLPWMAIMLFILGVALVTLPLFKSSRRTHLD